MYVEIVEPGRIELRDHPDCTYFHLAVPAGMTADAVANALGPLGASDGKSASLEVSSVRAMAEALGVDAAWHVRFEQMIEYARSRGWLSEDESRLTAHVERAR